jgi:hypothetical protein
MRARVTDGGSFSRRVAVFMVMPSDGANRSPSKVRISTLNCNNQNCTLEQLKPTCRQIRLGQAPSAVWSAMAEAKLDQATDW